MISDLSERDGFEVLSGDGFSLLVPLPRDLDRARGIHLLPYAGHDRRRRQREAARRRSPWRHPDPSPRRDRSVAARFGKTTPSFIFLDRIGTVVIRMNRIPASGQLPAWFAWAASVHHRINDSGWCRYASATRGAYPGSVPEAASACDGKLLSATHAKCCMQMVCAFDSR